MPAPDPAPEDFPALLRGVARSFDLSIRLLPRPLRRPVGLGYLLARATDTVADTAELPASERMAVLSTLAAAVEGDATAVADAASAAASFAGRQHNEHERRLMLALPRCLDELAVLDPRDRAAIRAVLRHITHGQGLDVQRFGAGGAVRALATAAELDEYTYLVAGSVGEFWTDLCVRHLVPFTDLPLDIMRTIGRSYGSALQLVNILRDTPADLAAGRCYWPADELAAAGLDAARVAAQPQLLAPVWLRWHSRAVQGLANGITYANAIHSRRARAASALPALLGIRTLALMRQAGPDALARPVKMPRSEVRATLLRIALTLANRHALQADYGRMAGAAVTGRWDNPPR